MSVLVQDYYGNYEDAPFWAGYSSKRRIKESTKRLAEHTKIVEKLIGEWNA